MQRISIIVLFLSFLLVAVSCSSPTKITSFKPEPDDAVPLAYDNSPSYINLPISLQLKDIENKTNSLLNGLIYKDTTTKDNNIKLKI